MIDRPASSDAFSTSRVTLLIVATKAHTIRHFLLPYAAHFRSLGWRVEAAASGATGDWSLDESFDRVFELPLSRSLLDAGRLARGMRVLSEVLESRPDIVHVHTPIAAFLTRAAVRRMPAHHRPAVAYTAHGFHFHAGGNPLTNALFLTAERVAGRWTDRLIVINDEDEAAARRHRLVPPSRLVHMPGIGVDTRVFSRSSIAPADILAARERFGIPPDAPLFIVVAELSRRKRVGDAIAALALTRDRRAHLLLAGPGSERAHLEKLAADLRLRQRVHFAGFLQDVRSSLATATALILSSSREGLARSIMEALALEVPVIASTARGNRELLAGDSGIVFDTGDVHALAAAMDWMIEHPDERQAMGQRGRQRMVEQYDLHQLVQLHEALYREMLGERPPRAV
jgi:glycosyltransferase involved in cell wall biosynthesis